MAQKIVRITPRPFIDSMLAALRKVYDTPSALSFRPGTGTPLEQVQAKLAEIEDAEAVEINWTDQELGDLQPWKDLGVTVIRPKISDGMFHGYERMHWNEKTGAFRWVPLQK